MGDVREVKPLKLDEASDAVVTLREALGSGCESVIVIGIDAEGMVEVRSSSVNDRLRMVGAIELAKLALLEE